MKEISVLTKSIQDYFTTPMLKLVIYPLLGSAFVLYLLFFGVANIGLDSLENTQLQIQHHQTQIENGAVTTIEENHTYTGNGILDFLLKYTVTSWIVSFLVYTVGLFAMGYLSIFISLLIAGLLTPKILALIHHKHYSNIDLEEGYGTIFGGIWKLIKTFLVMLGLLVILIPFYFIPLVNIVAINIPFYYFFHKMLHYDVGSTIMSKEQFGKIYFPNKTSMRAKTILLYVVSLIPFVAFFIAIFYIIYLGHSYFSLIKEDN